MGGWSVSGVEWSGWNGMENGTVLPLQSMYVLSHYEKARMVRWDTEFFFYGWNDGAALQSLCFLRVVHYRAGCRRWEETFLWMC